MPSTATVTAKTGPGFTLTAGLFTGVTSINFFPAPKDVLQISCDQGIKEFDIAAVTTITATISGGAITLTVS